jgi:hypothetical protein
LLPAQPIYGKRYADENEKAGKDHVATLELNKRHDHPEDEQYRNDRNFHNDPMFGVE